MKTQIANLILLIVFSLYGCKPDPKFTEGKSKLHYVNLDIPKGMPKLDIPADNPLTEEGIALGRKLFYDPILSLNNKMSCASCHQFENYFADSNFKVSTGVDGIQGTRNAPALFNVAYSKTFFWDGGARDLESQVIGPITNPVEMHENIANVISKLQNHPQYPNLFKQVFGTDKIQTKYLLYAIAQFERTLFSANSKFDKWKRGEIQLTAQEERGLQVYIDEKKGDCLHCHTLGSTFTDFEFRNIGLDSIPIDLGRYRVSLISGDEGKFKTPTLRNIAMTAPYMHDGRFQTLRECIDLYNTDFFYTKNLAPELQTSIKGRMNEDDIHDLIVFLHTLTDSSFLSNIKFAKPE